MREFGESLEGLVSFARDMIVHDAKDPPDWDWLEWESFQTHPAEVGHRLDVVFKKLHPVSTKHDDWGDAARCRVEVVGTPLLGDLYTSILHGKRERELWV